MQPRVDVGRSFAIREMGARGSEEPPGNPDRYRQQSMILVPLPHPGVVAKRILPVFGYDETPHGHAEVVFDNVRVPAEKMCNCRRSHWSCRRARYCL
jgi:hypothetical protein